MSGRVHELFNLAELETAGEGNLKITATHNIPSMPEAKRPDVEKGLPDHFFIVLLLVLAASCALSWLVKWVIDRDLDRSGEVDDGSLEEI